MKGMGVAMKSQPILPLYQKLAEDLKSQIEDGSLKENEKLPSELELSQEYSVSRITLRKAMEILAEERYIIKHQGLGTFVAPRKLNRIDDGRRMGFTEVCANEGKTASAEILGVEWLTAKGELGRNLRVEEGEKVFKLSRIRGCDGIPVMIEVLYFSSRFSYLLQEDLTKSVYAVLREHGDIPSHSVRTVEVGYAGAREEEYLGMKQGEVLLLLNEKALDESGEVIHSGIQIINPQRYKLTIIN